MPALEKPTVTYLGQYYHYKIIEIFANQSKTENFNLNDFIESCSTEEKINIPMLKILEQGRNLFTQGHYLADLFNNSFKSILKKLEDSFRQSTTITDLFHNVVPLVSLSGNSQVWLDLFWQLVNISSIYRQEILLPEHNLNEQEKGLLKFFLTVKDNLKKIPTVSEYNPERIDPFNDSEYWQAIRDKVKATIPVIIDQPIPANINEIIQKNGKLPFSEILELREWIKEHKWTKPDQVKFLLSLNPELRNKVIAEILLISPEQVSRGKKSTKSQ